mgnify:CR=1 FL=1
MDHPHCNRIEWQRLRDNREISVLLIRHGQTEWNKERRFLGRTDIPLDDTGRTQAAKLAESIEHIPLAAIYSSPLTRAWGTAEAIAKERSRTITAVDALTELNQGDLEGRFGIHLEQDFPDFFAAWQTDPTHVRIPGGETLAECSDRAIRGFLSIMARHEPGEPIAIVSHKVAISAILCHALGQPIRANMAIQQHNTAVNLLGFKDGTIQAYRVNDAQHLGFEFSPEQP